MTRRETVFKGLNDHRELYEQRTKSGIELYRKADMRLRFTDKNGNPLKNVKFNAKLAKHDFKFGCNLFMLDEFETPEKNKKFRSVFADTFNYAVVPFYWNTLEPEQGKPRYAKDSPRVYRRPSPDLCVEFCRENDIDMKGHCLVYDAFSPSWLPKDAAGIWREYDKHFEEIAARYKNDIPDWDVINETISWSPYSNSTAIFRDRRFVHRSYEMGRRYFTRNRLFINEAAQIWERFRFDRTAFYMQLEKLERDNVSFDAIGMQMHIFVPREKEMEERGAFRYDPLVAYDVMDTFGEFGKPLHISEVTVPTYCGGAEDDDVQAELLDMLYRMWFSHKSVEGIAYWNLVDGYAHGAPIGDMTAGENTYGGGLLNFDMSEKPAFKVIKKLIKEEWTTNISDSSDEGGMADFRGFKGYYDVEFFADGKRYTAKVHLGGNSNTPCEIKAE